MEIFYVVTSNKSVVYLLLLIYKGICILDLLALFERLIQKNFLFSRVNSCEDVRDKWNFRAGCIDQIHCGYMYIRVRDPSK